MGKRLNISFRQTHSDRSATNAYRAYGKRNRRQISNIILRQAQDHTEQSRSIKIQNYPPFVAKLLQRTGKLKS